MVTFFEMKWTWYRHLRVFMPQGTLLQENHIVARRYIASFNMVNSFHVSKLLCRKIVHIVSISVHIYTCFGHGLSSF